jgi:RNA polymerase sigma factor FliA
MQFFKPFVVRRVNGALMDAIRASDWATRSLRTKAKALQEAGQDRGVTQAQLAERTGMTIAEVRATQRGMAQRPVSLEAEELDPGAATDVESSAFTADVLAAVVDRVRGLDPDQRTVLALHYFSGKQLQEVARTTESRASQLHAAAVISVHDAMLAAAKHQEPR